MCILRDLLLNSKNHSMNHAMSMNRSMRLDNHTMPMNCSMMKPSTRSHCTL